MFIPVLSFDCLGLNRPILGSLNNYASLLNESFWSVVNLWPPQAARYPATSMWERVEERD